MSKNKISRAISAVLAVGISFSANAADPQPANSMPQEMGTIKGMDKCYGVAKAGLNDCGTATHNCAGEAKKDSEKADWILTPTGLCSKIVGGSIKPT